MSLLNKTNNTAILLAAILSIIMSIGIARFFFTSLLPPMLNDYLTLTYTGILASLNFENYNSTLYLTAAIVGIGILFLLYAKRLTVHKVD